MTGQTGTTALRLAAVGDDAELARCFIDVPFRLYAEDPHWVPPLRSEAVKSLDRRKNPFFRHADVEHFVAFEGEVPVGRIAATVYPAYNSRFGTRKGFFGFFECAPVRDTARALLVAAERWLAERGMQAVAGPYNYVGTQEMGLLVEGFDRPPVAFQTYNPPAYRELIEACGYTPTFSMSTFRYSRDVAKALQPVIAAGEQLLMQGGFTTRLLDKRRFREDMRLVRELINESFASNSEVTPYEADVFEHMVGPLKSFVDVRLIRFIEQDGRPVAFTVMVPDLNVILAKLDGRVRVRDLLRLRQMRREVNAAVLLVVGRVPSMRGQGLGVAIVAELARGWLETGYEHLHTTWIHNQNDASLALARQFDNPPDKQFVVFGREL